MKYFVSGLLAVIASAANENYRVTSLPGQGDFDTYAVYSGYVPIAESTKQIHYMFVESQNDPVNDPLLIWFNGGPGCSSMLGWAQEHGPYVMESGTDFFVQNEWSWNKQANVLYIEQPAGVGFSYCEGFQECSFTDMSSSADNLEALQNWYADFPEFKVNDLYISGESYAGIYVPYLAHQVNAWNEALAESNVEGESINLKGYAVGNGVTNWKYDTNSAYIEMAYWHSLYSTELYDKIKAANCDFSGPYMQHVSTECQYYLDEFNSLVADVNIYDIFGICYGTDAYPANGKLYRGTSFWDYTPWLKPRSPSSAANELPPCTFGEPIMAYFDDADVRSALHIPEDYKTWELCTQDIHYKIGTEGSQWIYEELAGKIKMIHYSGDVDGAVPSLGTEGWIASLGWNTTNLWRPYMYDDQVAGYLEVYEGGLTYATVHGAGHMAPQFKRPQTYHLIFNWMFDLDI